MNPLHGWFPIARSEEVVSRHVVQAQLLEREIALWRDDTGALNAWENRCAHRGVRLSIGLNTGTELRCRYHGWRFASGNGQCTYIPAHPAQHPAGTIRATTYGVTERHGFAWASLDPQTVVPALPDLPPHGMTLRSIHVAGSAAAIARGLLRGYRLPTGDASVTSLDEHRLLAAAGANSADAAVTFLLQPMTLSQTVIHGLLHGRGDDGRRALLHHHNAHMKALRDAVELPC